MDPDGFRMLRKLRFLRIFRFYDVVTSLASVSH
jgi:hypothetical protein